MLKVKGLTVLRSGKTVLKDITFHLDKGRSLGIIGCSGAGKTTLAMAILGLLNEVLVMGEFCVNGKSAFVMQNPDSALNPSMKIKKQLKESMEKGTDMEALLGEVGIGEAGRVLRSYPHQLSGGTKQRILLAMAVSSGADLLVADEPAANLDPPLRLQMIRLIKRLVKERGLSIIFITHDISLAALLCDDLMVLSEGQMVEYGPVKALIESPGQEYTKKLITASRMELTGTTCS